MGFFIDHFLFYFMVTFQMIDPVASSLCIPSHRIFANNLLFSDEGDFNGFDPEEPTSRDGGKPAVIKRLMATHGYENVIMIGDGVTDMQAKPPACAFIGYGGVVEREQVRLGADWFVKDFDVRDFVCHL
jgi:phosphoserine phosphatase